MHSTLNCTNSCFQVQQRTFGSMKDFKRGRNGSVPSQLYNHNSSTSSYHNNNNNFDRERKVGGGILRRNSSRVQAEMALDYRMKQRRVAVSFNSSKVQLREFSPDDLVTKNSDVSGSTDI